MPSKAGILAISLTLCRSALSLGQGACSPVDITPQSFSRITFDYLIVGGGAGGLAVASRLAENPAVQVGVIEAGNFHQNDPLIDIPQNMGAPFGNPAYDWNLVTVPQPGALNRSIPATRGKILGGSTALNFLAWTRASQVEYDSWQSFVPGSSWSWEGMLPYFKKSEAIFLNQKNIFLPPASNSMAFDKTFEGINGPIQVSFNDVYPDPVAPFIKSVDAIGIDINPDPDNGDTTGLTNGRSSIDRATGTRSYAASGYYCRSVQRSNFHVLMNAQTTKILLSTNGKTGQITATGVQFVSGSKNFTVETRNEVILAAGVYQSPQLLELSGIGNKKILEKLGIETLVDLPSVGENLQDHLASEVQYRLKPGVLTFDELRNNATFANEQALIFNKTHQGLLAASNSILTFVPFPAFLKPSQIASILTEFDKSVGSLDASPFQRKQYTIQREWLGQGTVPQIEVILFNSGFIAPVVNQSYITVIAGQLHHLNRGSVHINTSIPLSPPVINPGWLDNNFDVSIGIEGIKLSTLIGSTRPLSDIIQEKTDPSPDIQSDASLINYFRGTVGSFDHPMGTNAMASRDLGGVVDAQLKVYGTTNLRVCDASIIPMGVGTHLQSTVYAIAEKLADMIKQDQPNKN